jgi:hypothetical protein
MKKNLEINWKSKPEKEDYGSAKEYLALLYDEKKAAKLASQLKKGRIMTFPAKDIFRASRLPLLDISNAEVKADHKKIVGNKKLSPLLLSSCKTRHDRPNDHRRRLPSALCRLLARRRRPNPVQNRLTYSRTIVASEG